jgi:hypothetical protein
MLVQTECRLDMTTEGRFSGSFLGNNFVCSVDGKELLVDATTPCSKCGHTVGWHNANGPCVQDRDNCKCTWPHLVLWVEKMDISPIEEDWDL